MARLMKIQHRPYLVGIDPGLSGTGYALFNYVDKIRLASGCVRVRRVEGVPWVDRAANIVWQLFVKIEQAMDHTTARRRPLDAIGYLVIEFPGHWASSGRSQAATARGDLLKLAYLCGAIDTAARGEGMYVSIVSPSEWKGQLTKTAVWARLEKRVPESMPLRRTSSHEPDAIGIAAWKVGLF